MLINEFLPPGLNRDHMRRLMAEWHLDGILLTSPENVFYVTGYTTLPMAGNPILYLLRNWLPFFAFMPADGYTTRALAWEVAPFGIRVNSISPGSVDTPMLRSDIQLESQRLGRPFDEIKADHEAEQALGRWAAPAEIAESAWFLAGETASFITGADLLVDGGWVAR